MRATLNRAEKLLLSPRQAKKRQQWRHDDEIRLWALYRDLRNTLPILTTKQEQDIGIAIREAWKLGKKTGHEEGGPGPW